MTNFFKHKKQTFISFLTLLILALFACTSKFQFAKKRLNANQENCQTMTFLQKKFKNGFSHSKYKGKTTLQKIDSKEIIITQDTIQVILENDSLDFSRFLQQNLINTKIFVEDLDFMKDNIIYQEKNSTSIKHTLYIFGVEQLKCRGLENNIKRYMFHTCIGEFSSNGIIYYAEIKEGLKSEEPDKLVYLLSWGLAI